MKIIAKANMEVFNKLYSQVSSSVSSTVSQLSGVLPGNPVTREFEATAHIASAGPGLLWKIYKGSKRSTKQEVSIFVFEKRQLEKWNKTDREIVLETLRRGVAQLTKIRHPQILTVQHPMEESRDSLAFATEPVFASLANVLGKTTNMPQPANMADHKLFDIEIKYGLLQLTEGLAFLHNDVKLVHKNICPETVIINKQGAWKIFGLDFCVLNTSPANSSPVYPHDGFSPTLPDVTQPNLDYLAPECVLSQSLSTASDMFSLGMLAYAVTSPGKQTFSPVKDIQGFRARSQQLKNLNHGKLQNVPDTLREYVKLLLNVTPEVRPDAHQFLKIPYFDDVGVKILNYLDSLLQWDNLQKSQFYKGLPEALPKLPHRVKVQRVLSCLVRDLAQPPMVPFVLPSIFDIAQDCTRDEYCSYILPHIKPVMKLMDPIQILLLMLQRMELLLKLTPPEDIQQHVLPMLYRGLDSDSPQIHELCLSVLPTFAGLLDHSNVKNSLLPRIKKLCLSTSSLSVRVNCLLCVGKLLEHLDKWLVLDEVLPFLPQIPSREPAVLMGILGIYKLALNHKKLGISKEVLATRVLPFLMPLCIENGLTLTQFNALTALVKEMFQMVETEHRTKLEQLNSVKDEQKVLAATMPTISNSSSKPVELDKAFTGLGLDSYVGNSSAPSMSLEEKQKVAQQQESLKLFQNQATLLEPAKTSKRDLNSDWTKTSHSNNKTTWASPNSSNVNYNVSGLSSLNVQNVGTTMVPTSVPTNQNFGQVGTSSLGVTTPNRNLGNSTSFSSFSSTPSNPWGNNNSMGGQSNNWSAFDTLLPNTGSNRVPMNQMMGEKSILLPSSNSSTSLNNSNNNALSKDEIMDLLS